VTGIGAPYYVDLTVLPVAGTYTIYMDPQGNGTGSVTVKLYTVPADVTGTITVGGSSVVSTNTTPGQNMQRTFTGSVNQKVSLDMTAGTITSDVTIKKPDGTALVGPVGVGNSWSSGTLTLPAAGTYTIYMDPRSNAVGSHTLKLNSVVGFAPVPGLADFASFIGSSDTVGARAAGQAIALRPETHPAPPPAAPPIYGGTEEWRPDPRQLGGGWTTGRKHSAWEDQAKLKASAGVTAVSGLVLNLAGNPMAGVTLSIGDVSVQSDIKGRFLIQGIEAGRTQLHIDGRSANRPGRTYGTFEVGLTTIAGTTYVLPYTIWMPKLDTAHVVKLPKTITHEIVVTTPYIPGLELHIPAGSQIVDEDGNPVTEVGITPVPVDRPPFFLPKNVHGPVYFTIQPGGAYIKGGGGVLVYPNYQHLAPGVGGRFYHYDPDVMDWYVYGHGQVTADGRTMMPDPGVRLYEFTGSMFPGGSPANTGPVAGGAGDGDPVDLATGLFVLRKTDLIEPGPMPLSLTRTYRPNDPQSRVFGVGADFDYSMQLYSQWAYQQVDLVLAGSTRIHYVRTSPGTGWTDAVFTTTATPTAFNGSTIVWNGTGWDLKTRDGTVYVFPSEAPLESIRDRNGNTVTLTRAGSQSGLITRISATGGRWIAFSYDASNRITSATDQASRLVTYQYDASGRLWKVTDSATGVTEYTYNTASQIVAVKDARGITTLQNGYDANGVVCLFKLWRTTRHTRLPMHSMEVATLCRRTERIRAASCGAYYSMPMDIQSQTRMPSVSQSSKLRRLCVRRMETFRPASPIVSVGIQPTRMMRSVT
jgi:YD repeat-containing protein